MAFDIGQFFNSLGTGFGQGLANVGTSVISSLANPNKLIGTGLLAGGLLSDKEPGEVAQARQFLRNRFTSPTALTDQFSGQLAGLSSTFQPYLQQQQNQLLNEVQQRFIAGQPAGLSTAMSGVEAQSMRDAIARYLIPQQQTFLGNLGLEMLNQQGRAAEDLLFSSQQNPLAMLSALLGYNLLSQPGGATTGGGGGAGGGGTAGGAAGGLQGLLSNPAVAQALNRMLSSTLPNPQGGIEGGSGLLNQIAAQLAGQSIPGLFEAIAGQGAAGAGASGAGAAGTTTGFQGLLGTGTAGSLGAGVGAAGAGFAVGDLIGPHLPNQATAGLAGAGGGAAAGAAVGAALADGPGAVIGAIAGGLFGAGGGVFGKSSSTREQKQASIQQEQQLTDQSRPAILQQAQRVVAQSQALYPQIETEIHPPYTRLNVVGQRLASNDGQATQWLQAVGQQLGALGDETAIKHDLPNTLEGAAQAMRLIIRATGIIQEYSPQSPTANADGSETNWGLLQSGETGKFNPGVQKFNQRLKDFNSAMNLYQQFLQLAGV